MSFIYPTQLCPYQTHPFDTLICTSPIGPIPSSWMHSSSVLPSLSLTPIITPSPQQKMLQENNDPNQWPEYIYIYIYILVVNLCDVWESCLVITYDSAK